MNRWLIVGGGVSGLGAAKLLRKQGKTVRISEGRPLSREKARAFLDLGCEVLDSGHEATHLDRMDAVVPSPGLPPSHPLLVQAKARGLQVVSEIDLALGFFSGRLIGVTGTNGKSTTCAMLGHLLTNAGIRASVGGNFGDPPTAQIAEERIGDVLVLELSSYQLEQSASVRADCAVMTSFSPDHMGRHGDLRGYLAAKWKLFTGLKEGGRAIVPSYVLARAKAEGLGPLGGDLWHLDEQGKDSWPAGLGLHLDGPVLVLGGGTSVDLTETGVKAPHDRLNAAYALLAAEAVTGRPLAELVPFLKGFSGLPHRLETVGTLQGIRIVNDSKATNVESVVCALAAQEEPVWLWLGGQTKGGGLEEILRFKDKIAGVVAFGESRDLVVSTLTGKVQKVLPYPSLSDALADIPDLVEMTGATGAWLFSPGGASFDEFANFEARGDAFKRAFDGILDRNS